MQADKEAVDLYRQFAKFTQTTEVSFPHARCGDALVVNTVQSQRDLERVANIKFSKSYCVKVAEDGSSDVIYSSNPQEISNELWNKESPSGKYRAVVRKVTDKKQEEKYYIEIWDENHKIENIDALSLEKHGKIYDADGYFGCLEWSHGEDRLLYVAEKRYKKAVSFFTKTKEGEEDKTAPGEEYVFREEWGEGLVGKHHPVICVLTVASGEVSVVEGVPDNVSAGQAIWSPTDEGIIFTGWQHEPYRLGLIYCPIRKNALLHVNLKTGQCDVLSSEEKSARCHVLSPDQKTLIYLQNKNSGPHMQCQELMLYDLASKTTRTVVQEVSQAKLGDFPGLYTVLLQRDCWADDSQRLVFSSVWNSQVAALVVNVKSGHISRLPSDSSSSGVTVLGMKNDLIVAQCSSPCRPFYLIVGKLPAEGQEAGIQWRPLESSSPQIDDIAWKIVTHQPTPERVNPACSSLEYESVFIYNKNQANKRLIIFPHGGPHSAFTTEFMLYPSLLCKLGFASLLVNYRGSIGFGSDSINCLPGRVGDQDVKDVQSAALEIIDKEGFDKEKVVVWGGSHGGFLTCHLIGQYPGFYKAAVCRNPVINMATLAGTSDIPDWTATESGLDFKYDVLPTPDISKQMWNVSPLQYAHKITTPLMIMIGTDDKRCHPKQSYELYKALKAKNLPVRFIAYPDNGHPIVKVDSEADAFINIYKWFTQHL